MHLTIYVHPLIRSRAAKDRNFYWALPCLSHISFYFQVFDINLTFSAGWDSLATWWNFSLSSRYLMKVKILMMDKSSVCDSFFEAPPRGWFLAKAKPRGTEMSPRKKIVRHSWVCSPFWLSSCRNRDQASTFTCCCPLRLHQGFSRRFTAPPPLVLSYLLNSWWSDA